MKNINNELMAITMVCSTNDSNISLPPRDLLLKYETTDGSIAKALADGLNQFAESMYSALYNHVFANYMVNRHQIIFESLINQYINSNQNYGTYIYEEFGLRFSLYVCSDKICIVVNDCMSTNETSLKDELNPDENNSKAINATVDDIKKIWCNILENNRDLILATKAWCYVDEMYELAISDLPTLADNEAVLLSWDWLNAGIVAPVDNKSENNWVKKGIALGCNVILHFEHRGGSVVKYLKVR